MIYLLSNHKFEDEGGKNLAGTSQTDEPRFLQK